MLFPYLGENLRRDEPRDWAGAEGEENNEGERRRHDQNVGPVVIANLKTKLSFNGNLPVNVNFC